MGRTSGRKRPKAMEDMVEARKKDARRRYRGGERTKCVSFPRAPKHPQEGEVDMVYSSGKD